MNQDSVRSNQKVHAFLRHNPMGILSTVNAEGQPWGSAVFYVSDEDFKFYFVTRAGTLKFKNIENSPLASLTIANNETQTTVQVAGTISKVPLKEYGEIIFGKLMDARPKNDEHWIPPLAKIHEGDYVPLCLTPSKLQYADFQHRKADGIRADYIEKIIGG